MYAGIDIGGTNIKGVLADSSGKILSERSTVTPVTKKEIDKEIGSLIENLATSASISKIDIKAIGIGAAGSIDRNKGIVISSPNISAWKKYPLAKNIEKLTGAKVFLENDATVALIGGWWKGHGSKFKNWIMLTLGTGIGGGVIIDNRIYTGQTGSAMEVGHMSIDYEGKLCKCGRKGCLEQYASATALVEYVQENLASHKGSSLNKRIEDEEISAKMIFEEAQNGDGLAVEAIEKIAYFLGIGVSNLVNIFNPEAIIFGGGLSLAHKMIIPVVKKVVDKNALPGLKENVKYLPIKDQSIIPALGAVKMAIDSMNSANN
jgi:glucokinase